MILNKILFAAKIFQNGGSQAVRLPKEFQFKGKEVFIHREGSKIILSEKPDSREAFFPAANHRLILCRTESNQI